MSRTICWTMVLLLVAVWSLPAGAEVKDQDTHYVVGNGIITIACSAEPHPLLPVGEPEPDAPVGWLLSGEPECAVADAHNAVREAQGEERVRHGVGGGAHAYDESDVGTVAWASTDDQVFGSAASYLRLKATGSDNGEYVEAAAEGCGPQSIVLPPEQGLPRPLNYWWAFVDAVGVDQDLEVCFATTGILHATWGA